jgi:hypothetical protein
VECPEPGRVRRRPICVSATLSCQGLALRGTNRPVSTNQELPGLPTAGTSTARVHPGPPSPVGHGLDTAARPPGRRAGLASTTSGTGWSRRGLPRGRALAQKAMRPPGPCSSLGLHSPCGRGTSGPSSNGRTPVFGSGPGSSKSFGRSRVPLWDGAFRRLGVREGWRVFGCFLGRSCPECVQGTEPGRKGTPRD